MKISKSRYLQGFLCVTLLLALVRCVFPDVAGKCSGENNVVENGMMQSKGDNSVAYADTGIDSCINVEEESARTKKDNNVHHGKSRFFKTDGSPVKNRIFSVPGFSKTFPDQNDVQMVSAKKYGVKPVANRKDAELRKAELVYIGSNPYFHIDKLNNSIAYLVPKASVLLQDIGRNFFDSLQCKGVPLHKIIVTSVLRTKEDIVRLQGHNSNATMNSCHLYGTTFDICYNRYKTVEAPGEKRRAVRNDTLKWIFSEVLRDMRDEGRCYVKYEVKQGCYHITVR